MAYQDGEKLKYYVDRSGGFTDNAMKRKAYVIYSDGTSAVTHNFLGHQYPLVEPGSQIVIPQKPVKRDSTAKWLAITTTLSSLMLALFTISRL